MFRRGGKETFLHRVARAEQRQLSPCSSKPGSASSTRSSPFWLVRRLTTANNGTLSFTFRPIAICSWRLFSALSSTESRP
jgi:hypothetical protein